jgi:hypothetical protein
MSSFFQVDTLAQVKRRIKECEEDLYGNQWNLSSDEETQDERNNVKCEDSYFVMKPDMENVKKLP